MGGGESGGVEEGEEAGVAIWSHLFKAVVALVRKLASAYSLKHLSILCQVRQLHSRDTRHQFCPSQHWIQPRLALPLDRPEGVSFHRSRFLVGRRLALLIGQLMRSNPGSEPIVPSVGSGSSQGKNWKVLDHPFLRRRYLVP